MSTAGVHLMTTMILVFAVSALAIFVLAFDVQRHLSHENFTLSPIDRIQRSLDARYARGELTANDYERVLRLVRD